MINFPNVLEDTCSGNSGRSKVLELLLRQELEKRKLDQIYKVISSGTHVDEFAQATPSDETIYRNLKLALDRDDVYTLNQIEAIEVAKQNENIGELSHFYQIAVDKFKAEEHANREIALKKLGLFDQLDPVPRQTVARDDTIVVLSMAKFNNEKVKEIYKGNDHQPIIDTIGGFVGGEDIINPFGLAPEVYMGAVDQMIAYAPLVVDKICK